MSIFFNGVVNSVFCVSIGTLRWKTFSKNLFKFSIFLRTSTGKNSLIRQAFFSQFEEIPFYVSIDIFWGELFEKNFSLSFLDNEHNFLCCKNCVLRVPRNILTKFFLKQMCISLSFPDIEQTIFDSLSKKLKQGCQNCILRVYRNSSKVIFPWKNVLNFFSSSGTEGKNFRYLSIFSKGLSIAYSTCP